MLLHRLFLFFPSCVQWGLLSSCGVQTSHCDGSSVAKRGLQDTRASVAVARGSGVVTPWFLSTGSMVVAHGLSCSMACGISPDQGLNPCLLHWQADSPLLSLCCYCLSWKICSLLKYCAYFIHYINIKYILYMQIYTYMW